MRQRARRPAFLTAAPLPRFNDRAQGLTWCDFPRANRSSVEAPGQVTRLDLDEGRLFHKVSVLSESADSKSRSTGRGWRLVLISCRADALFQSSR